MSLRICILLTYILNIYISGYDKKKDTYLTNLVGLLQTFSLNLESKNPFHRPSDHQVLLLREICFISQTALYTHLYNTRYVQDLFNEGEK